MCVWFFFFSYLVEPKLLQRQKPQFGLLKMAGVMIFCQGIGNRNGAKKLFMVADIKSWLGGNQLQGGGGGGEMGGWGRGGWWWCGYGDHRDLHSFPRRRSSDLRRNRTSVSFFRDGGSIRRGTRRGETRNGENFGRGMIPVDRGRIPET